jgi:hypothetical protein
MKRVVSFFLIFLCIVLLCRASILEVHATNEMVFFEDDFEKYDVGTFPYGGGWELWFDGMGSEYQVVVDNVSNSPAKSLQLLGLHDLRAAYAAKPFADNTSRIGFEVSIRVDEIPGGAGDLDVARAGFCELIPPVHARLWAPILFLDNGSICVGGERNWPMLQSYVSGRWYRVKLIIDRSGETCSVWVDDVLEGEDLAVTPSIGNIVDNPSSGIKAFSVSQNYNSVRVYYDDLKVFSARASLIGDFNRDGVVDLYDALLMAQHFAAKQGDLNWDPIADLNGDAQVDIYDFIILLRSFGKRS